MISNSFLKAITCLLLVSFVLSGIPGQTYPISSYKLDSILPNEDDTALIGLLTYKGEETSYGNSANSIIKKLKLTVNFVMEDQFQIKIEDAEKKRWELPETEPFPRVDPQARVTIDKSIIQIDFTHDPFGFTVKRKGTNNVIFDTTNSDFIFTDYYLEISTEIPTPNIYGFGERAYKFNLGPSGTYTLWNVDFSKNIEDGNLGHGSYGTHPVYLMKEKGSQWSMVHLRNVNAMSLECKDSKTLTYRVTGGILDFHFFIGNPLLLQPEGVVIEYHKYLGGWALPPFWALGYHQSKQGYKDLQTVKNLISSFNKHELPFDAIWSDSDYLDDNKIFTVAKTKFPVKDFKSLLENNQKKWIPIIDCGISIDSDFYKEAPTQGVFIKRSDGTNFVGKTKAGDSVWIDWFHHYSANYWTSGLEKLKNEIPYAGVWLDKNEISNLETEKISSSDADIWNNLPYSPTGYPLHTNTLVLDAHHSNGVTEFNAHNIFNLMQSHVTYNHLKKSSPLPFTITRANVFGSGRYGAHWTGDIASSWKFLKLSISSIMSFNIYGIPMVGSDICGSDGEASEELCARWMQLGALYPFARNHANNEKSNQEPWALGKTALETSKIAIRLRYSLLKHYYTVFLESFKSPFSKQNKVGLGTVFRPLFFEFSEDKTLLDLKLDFTDTQFMLGNALMVAPVVEQGAQTRKVYFPEDEWFDFFTGKRVITKDTSRTLEFSAPLKSTVPMFLRSGLIVAVQDTRGVLSTSDLDNVYELVAGLESTLDGLVAEGFILGLKDLSDSNVVNKCIGPGCLIETDITVEEDGSFLNIIVEFTKSGGNEFEEIEISGFKLYGVTVGNNVNFNSQFLVLKPEDNDHKDVITVQAVDGALSIRFFSPRKVVFEAGTNEEEIVWKIRVPITDSKLITK